LHHYDFAANYCGAKDSWWESMGKIHNLAGYLGLEVIYFIVNFGCGWIPACAGMTVLLWIWGTS